MYKLLRGKSTEMHCKAIIESSSELESDVGTESIFLNLDLVDSTTSLKSVIDCTAS